MLVHPCLFGIKNSITIAMLFKKKEMELTVGLLLIGRIIVGFYKFIISLLFKMSTRSAISYN